MWNSPLARRAGCVAILLFALCTASEFASVASAQTDRGLELYRRKFTEQRDAFRRQLEDYAAQLEASGHDDGVRAIRELLAPADNPNELQVLPNPPRVMQAEIPAGLPEAERAWRLRLRFLRQQQAVALYDLSRTAMQSDHASLAYELLHEVIHLDSDHAAARRLLGYVTWEGEWLTPFEKTKRQKKELWDDRFGWIPESELPRYEQGQRKFRNRWIDAAQEAQFRRAFDNAWEIRTEHFLVKTNHSLERGAEVARKLEEFHQFILRAFPGLFNSREQMRKLYSATATQATLAKNAMTVHVYRDRNEYVSTLQSRIPIIARTNGLYLQKDRVSYFFHDDQNDDSTLYHEATHQILFEGRAGRRDIAQAKHFWVVEGLACYMESFRIDDGRVSLGDPWFIRFDNARSRLILDKYYRPLDLFSSWGATAFQQQPELPLNYSQASGLTHFFLHAEQGKYRDAFIEHVAGIYTSRANDDGDVPTLDRLTGRGYGELDKDYVLYIQRQARELANQPIPDYIRRELDAPSRGRE